MTKLSRRKFLSFLAVAPVVPYTLPYIPKEEIVAEANFGFTFGNVLVKPEYITPKQGVDFAEIVRHTLQERSSELRENILKSNGLLLKLQDNKYVKVNKISPEIQIAQINEKIEQRRLARQAKRCSSLNERIKWREEIHKHNSNIYFEDYDSLENRFRST